jgi:hypothetical protein
MRAAIEADERAQPRQGGDRHDRIHRHRAGAGRLPGARVDQLADRVFDRFLPRLPGSAAARAPWRLPDGWVLPLCRRAVVLAAVVGGRALLPAPRSPGGPAPSRP